MPLEELTIGEALKQEGYQTAHIGKWNCSVDSLTYPQYQGYDINIAGCNKGGPGKGGYFSPYHNPYLKDGPEESISQTGWVMNVSVSYVNSKMLLSLSICLFIRCTLHCWRNRIK